MANGRVSPAAVPQQDPESGKAEEVEEPNNVAAYVCCFLVYLIAFPIALCMSFKVAQEYERAVVFRLGRAMQGVKGPGLLFVIPCVDEIRVVDLRTIAYDVPPQEILTKDSVTVAVDAVMYYRVFDPFMAVVNVENAMGATGLLAQTTLRNILGTKTLAEILSEREAVSHQMQVMLDEGTDRWGIKVERVEIKDVRLPQQLQRAMAAEAEAAREARAKVISAEGEQKASVALKQAADVINESPGAIQLRFLQTMNTVSAVRNQTYVLPIPIELIKKFMKKK